MRVPCPGAPGPHAGEVLLRYQRLRAREGSRRLARHFYRHFSSKEEVLERYISCLIRAYEREIVEGRGFSSYIVPENIVAMARWFEKNAAFVETLLRNHMGDFLREPIVQHMLGLSLRSEADPKERMLATAYANALFGLLAQWVEDGMKTPPEDIADTLCALYQRRMRRI